MREAFLHYANIEIDDCLEDVAEFAKRITEQGICVAEDDRWDDLFFRVMAEKIEPFLGMDVPCILYDYPASMASLSRRKPADTRYAERFELYVCGIELANAFSELTDPTEQRTRFEEEMDLKDKLYGERCTRLMRISWTRLITAYPKAAALRLALTASPCSPTARRILAKCCGCRTTKVTYVGKKMARVRQT